MISKFFFKKNAISPIISIILLFLVSVLSVVSFQIWFGSFSSGNLSLVETSSEEISLEIELDKFIFSSIYIKNPYPNITISELKIDGLNCNISSFNSSLPMIKIEINLTDTCILNKSGKYEMALVTNKGVYRKYFFLN